MRQSALLRHSHEDFIAKTHRHNVRLYPVNHPRSLSCSSGERQVDGFMKVVEIKRFRHCVGFCTNFQLSWSALKKQGIGLNATRSNVLWCLDLVNARGSVKAQGGKAKRTAFRQNFPAFLDLPYFCKISSSGTGSQSPHLSSCSALQAGDSDLIIASWENMYLASASTNEGSTMQGHQLIRTFRRLCPSPKPKRKRGDEN